MHFSVECVARRWTVTEPTAPTLVRRVVEARVCEALRDWRLVAVRVGSFFSNVVTVATDATKIGLPWHQSVTLISGG